MDTNNVTQLRSTTFNYDQIRGVVCASLISAGALSETDKGWTLAFDRPVPGLTTSDDMRFANKIEATEFVLPYIMSGWQQIVNKAAA